MDEQKKTKCEAELERLEELIKKLEELKDE